MSKPHSHAATLHAFLKKMPSSTIAEIMEGTGLSRGQIASGINHYRNTYGPMLGENPVINVPWTIFRKRDGAWVRSTYKLSDSAKEIKDYGAYRIRINAKQMLTTARTLESGYEATGDMGLKLLAHSVHQMVNTAEFVVQELMGGKAKAGKP